MRNDKRNTKVCFNDNDYATNVCTAAYGAKNNSDFDPQRVLEMLNKLTDRERRIMECRYGYRRTLSSISSELGLCREWVRQIEHRVLRKLRHPLNRLELSGQAPDSQGEYAGEAK